MWQCGVRAHVWKRKPFKIQAHNVWRRPLMEKAEGVESACLHSLRFYLGFFLQIQCNTMTPRYHMQICLFPWNTQNNLLSRLSWINDDTLNIFLRWKAYIKFSFSPADGWQSSLAAAQETSRERRPDTRGCTNTEGTKRLPSTWRRRKWTLITYKLMKRPRDTVSLWNLLKCLLS